MGQSKLFVLCPKNRVTSELSLIFKKSYLFIFSVA